MIYGKRIGCTAEHATYLIGITTDNMTGIITFFVNDYPVLKAYPLDENESLVNVGIGKMYA